MELLDLPTRALDEFTDLERNLALEEVKIAFVSILLFYQYLLQKANENFFYFQKRCMKILGGDTKKDAIKLGWNHIGTPNVLKNLNWTGEDRVNRPKKIGVQQNNKAIATFIKGKRVIQYHSFIVF